ncbi:acyl-CoA dehydrogenase family protein [Streptomyces sp. NBC_00390]|uniref:acyl-CoA dehydrogenase family protein n=1 Tax=Streptomyces sp. NBC_00390 TaxID=2975736 RepID=UPI002E2126A3
MDDVDPSVVAARTSPEKKARGITLFGVEAGMEGFTRGRKLDKVGQTESDTAELFFDEVRVQDTHVIGEVDQGFVHMMGRLPQERLGAAVSNVAHAAQILEETVEYTKERKAFGQSIGSFQHNKSRQHPRRRLPLWPPPRGVHQRLHPGGPAGVAGPPRPGRGRSPRGGRGRGGRAGAEPYPRPARTGGQPAAGASGDPTVPDLQAWLHDAVLELAVSDELADAEAGTILQAYYLGRASTHHQVACRLHLSRATYFRRLRRGLEAVAARLPQPDA